MASKENSSAGALLSQPHLRSGRRSRKGVTGRAGKSPLSGRKVMIWCGGDPVRGGSSAFFRHLFWQLIVHGREKGAEVLPVTNDGAEKHAPLCPPGAARAIANGAEAIVGIMLSGSMTEWIMASGMPYSILQRHPGDPRRVVIDYMSMIEPAFSRLAKLGCRSVGLLMPVSETNAALLEKMDETAGALGLEVKYEWIIASYSAGHEIVAGYNQFQSIWKLREKPDGLIVFPDLTASGVVSAIVEKGIRVPEEVRLILHRNAETPYSIPFPCDWIEVSIREIARALIGSLEKQVAGEPVEKVVLPIPVIEGE